MAAVHRSANRNWPSARMGPCTVTQLVSSTGLAFFTRITSRSGRACNTFP